MEKEGSREDEAAYGRGKDEGTKIMDGDLHVVSRNGFEPGTNIAALPIAR